MNQNLTNIRIQKYELVATFITRLASCYGKVLTDDDMETYADVLMGMEVSDLRHAMEIYTSDSRNRGFPSPFVLKACLIPEPRELAVDAVGKILSALRKFHSDTAEHDRQARAYIGELGWLYVQNQGGWWSMKRAEFEMGEQAQAREWIMTQIKFKRLGIQGESHSFDNCLTPVGEARREEAGEGEKISLADLMEKAHSKAAEQEAERSPMPEGMKGMWKKLTPAPTPVKEIDYQRIAERQRFLKEQLKEMEAQAGKTSSDEHKPS